jgi:class 3 adenylate cyclase
MTQRGLLAVEDRWKQLDATFLVIDIRGWSHIVYELGPNPSAAAVLVDSFWTLSESAVKAHNGEIYSWQGDALLVAFLGPRLRRVEKALRTAVEVHDIACSTLGPQCWKLLRKAAAKAQYAGTGGSPSPAIQFAVSSAITDGRAIAVPRRDSDRYSEELTGDCVNLAFAIVKEVAPHHIGITEEVHSMLEQRPSSAATAIDWWKSSEYGAPCA